MPYSTRLTVAAALEGLKKEPFPPDLVSEGDIAWWPGGKLGTDIGHRFKYTNGEWVSDPAELPNV